MPDVWETMTMTMTAWGAVDVMEVGKFLARNGTTVAGAVRILLGDTRPWWQALAVRTLAGGHRGVEVFRMAASEGAVIWLADVDWDAVGREADRGARIYRPPPPTMDDLSVLPWRDRSAEAPLGLYASLVNGSGTPHLFRLADPDGYALRARAEISRLLREDPDRVIGTQKVEDDY